MKGFFRSNGRVLIIAALLLSILLGASAAFSKGRSGPLSNFVTVITTPFRSGTAAVLDWADGVYGYIFQYKDLYDELDLLRQKVAELEETVRENQEAAQENQKLRELLGLQAKRRDFVFESARITARSTSNWNSTLTLSKGASAGVAAGDCVVSETGVLVGVVQEVGHNYCHVCTIINPDIEMGGVVTRTYSAGILEGDFSLMEQGLLKLSYLPDKAQLVAGDEVLTSGTGDVYPSGLVVGKIQGVFTDPSGMNRYAVIKPSIDLDLVTEVFIIKDFDIVE